MSPKLLSATFFKYVVLFNITKASFTSKFHSVLRHTHKRHFVSVHKEEQNFPTSNFTKLTKHSYQHYGPISYTEY
jgi:hypothetical protein